jgi:hypothetical protein
LSPTKSPKSPKKTKQAPRRRHPFAPFVGGTLKTVPELPEAATLRDLGLPFTETELTHIRTAMALHKMSRQPQLTYDGWKVIGLALNIGEARAKQHAKGVVHSRGPYGQAIGRFLNATGFAFLNKGVRWALREWINNLEEVDGWHASLDPSDRAHLNNPIDVWDRYTSDQRKPKPSTKQHTSKRQHRDFPTLLEEVAALSAALEAVEERKDILEATLSHVLEAVPPASLERLPDELLRVVFANLPPEIQDAHHARLFPDGHDRQPEAEIEQDDLPPAETGNPEPMF